MRLPTELPAPPTPGSARIALITSVLASIRSRKAGAADGDYRRTGPCASASRRGPHRRMVLRAIGISVGQSSNVLPSETGYPFSDLPHDLDDLQRYPIASGANGIFQEIRCGRADFRLILCGSQNLGLQFGSSDFFSQEG